MKRCKDPTQLQIIQALKEKPRDGATLQRDLYISPDEIHDILKNMEAKGLIRWDSTERVWRVGVRR